MNKHRVWGELKSKFTFDNMDLDSVDNPSNDDFSNWMVHLPTNMREHLLNEIAEPMYERRVPDEIICNTYRQLCQRCTVNVIKLSEEEITTACRVNSESPSRASKCTASLKTSLSAVDTSATGTSANLSVMAELDSDSDSVASIIIENRSDRENYDNETHERRLDLLNIFLMESFIECGAKIMSQRPPFRRSNENDEIVIINREENSNEPIASTSSLSGIEKEKIDSGSANGISLKLSIDMERINDKVKDIQPLVNSSVMAENETEHSDHSVEHSETDPYFQRREMYRRGIIDNDNIDPHIKSDPALKKRSNMLLDDSEDSNDEFTTTPQTKRNNKLSDDSEDSNDEVTTTLQKKRNNKLSDDSEDSNDEVTTTPQKKRNNKLSDDSEDSNDEVSTTPQKKRNNKLSDDSEDSNDEVTTTPQMTVTTEQHYLDSLSPTDNLNNFQQQKIISGSTYQNPESIPNNAPSKKTELQQIERLQEKLGRSICADGKSLEVQACHTSVTKSHTESKDLQGKVSDTYLSLPLVSNPNIDKPMHTNLKNNSSHASINVKLNIAPAMKNVKKSSSGREEKYSMEKETNKTDSCIKPIQTSGIKAQSSIKSIGKSYNIEDKKQYVSVKNNGLNKSPVAVKDSIKTPSTKSHITTIPSNVMVVPSDESDLSINRLCQNNSLVTTMSRNVQCKNLNSCNNQQAKPNKISTNFKKGLKQFGAQLKLTDEILTANKQCAEHPIHNVANNCKLRKTARSPINLNPENTMKVLPKLPEQTLTSTSSSGSSSTAHGAINAQLLNTYIRKEKRPNSKFNEKEETSEALKRRRYSVDTPDKQINEKSTHSRRYSSEVPHYPSSTVSPGRKLTVTKSSPNNQIMVNAIVQTAPSPNVATCSGVVSEADSTVHSESMETPPATMENPTVSLNGSEVLQQRRDTLQENLIQSTNTPANAHLENKLPFDKNGLSPEVIAMIEKAIKLIMQCFYNDSRNCPASTVFPSFIRDDIDMNYNDPKSNSSSIPNTEYIRVFLSLYSHFFLNPVTTLVNKLAEILHLSIFDLKQCIERKERAMLLVSESFKIEETERANQDHYEMLSSRGEKFGESFLLLMSNFKMCQSTMMATAYFRIIQALLKIEKDNFKYISRLPKICGDLIINSKCPSSEAMRFFKLSDDVIIETYIFIKRCLVSLHSLGYKQTDAHDVLQFAELNPSSIDLSKLNELASSITNDKQDSSVNRLHQHSTVPLLPKPQNVVTANSQPSANDMIQQRAQQQNIVAPPHAVNPYSNRSHQKTTVIHQQSDIPTNSQPLGNNVTQHRRVPTFKGQNKPLSVQDNRYQHMQKIHQQPMQNNSRHYLLENPRPMGATNSQQNLHSQNYQYLQHSSVPTSQSIQGESTFQNQWNQQNRQRFQNPVILHPHTMNSGALLPLPNFVRQGQMNHNQRIHNPQRSLSNNDPRLQAWNSRLHSYSDAMQQRHPSASSQGRQQYSRDTTMLTNAESFGVMGSQQSTRTNSNPIERSDWYRDHHASCNQ